MCTALLAVLALVICIAAPARAAAPRAVIDGPETVATGLPIGFGAEGSTDPDGDPLTFAWSIDDEPLGIEHDWLAVSFAHPGLHVVRVVVTDAGGSSAVAEHPVTVTGIDRTDASVAPVGTSVFQSSVKPPELVVRPQPVRLRRNALRLMLRCRNAAVCRGGLRAVVLVGRRERALLLSKRRFTVTRGGPRVVRMWLSKEARAILRVHPRVRVTAYRGKVRVSHTWATYAYRVR